MKKFSWKRTLVALPCALLLACGVAPELEDQGCGLMSTELTAAGDRLIECDDNDPYAQRCNDISLEVAAIGRDMAACGPKY